MSQFVLQLCRIYCNPMHREQRREGDQIADPIFRRVDRARAIDIVLAARL
jgi:hypothetical protein